MNTKIIEILNKAVKDELSAIHQYLYFHFHCEDQGLNLLADLFQRTAVEEMRHVGKLADRILFLKGDVEMETGSSVQKIKSVKEMLTLARKMEEDSVKEYNTWAMECATNSDAISRQLFENLVADEERHYDQYNMEVENIEKFGDNYLALQATNRSSMSSK